ncbi:MAG: hypothetical protein H6737_00210 [Alphaproteobacteria bacterium]|nr:hypothetical protein [Alphaproteobacteria bacterium]
MSGDEKKPKPSTPEGARTGALDASRLDGASIDEIADFATEEIPTQEARRLETRDDGEEPWTDEVTEPGEARPSVLPELDDDPPTQQVEIDVTPKRYEMLDSLGVVGMGEVLRVRDRELDRVVCMTLLHPRFSMSPRSMTRFREGVLLGAGLQHPAIPPVYDAGMLPDGRMYYTTIEGQGATLSALAGVEAPVRRRVGWVARVAEAVAYAHDRGVVHGWLGPAVVRVGEPGRVMVHGWGFRPSTTERAFTAPELRGGQATEPSAVTDVFALGAVLFFVLTGRAPATAGDPVPPSAAGGAADDRLDAICLGAMSARAAERPATAGDLLGAIAAWIEGS